MKYFPVKFSFKTKLWAGILLAQIIFFYLLSFSQFAVHCAQELFERKKHLHQLLFCELPFSVGDLLYVFCIATCCFWIIRSLQQPYSQAAIKLLIFLNVFYFVYQIFWGLLYFSNPLTQKFRSGEVTVNEAKILAEKYLKRCVADRNFVSEDKNGVFLIRNISMIRQTILTGQKRLPSGFSAKKAVGTDDFKPSLFKKFMTDTGISGYYNPFTAEAQYDPAVPSTALPFTLAHESAHQLGYAREQEANFIGFLISQNSQNSDLMYSADYFALKSLLNFIASEDEIFVKKILKEYSSGMLRDRKYEKKFIKLHQGFLDDLFSFTNDLFLKSNQQDGSISYSYFTELLIKYENL